jgi:hypothetical protein
MITRRGKEFYGKTYDEAIRLHNEGKQISEIAKDLKISYSSAYHWIKGLRQPQAGSVSEFAQYVQANGPLSAVHLLKKFPKHNELFLIASRRGIEIKRMYLGKKYRELATWYYFLGQEKELEQRIEDVKRKIESLRSDMRSKLEY